jgi:hypothetical protein
MADPESVVNPIRKTLRLLVVATVVLYLFVIVVSGLAFSNSQRTEDALCAVRGDLEGRVEGSQDFLHEHPNGFAGISPAVIREGLQNEQHTIDALGSISC